MSKPTAIDHQLGDFVWLLAASMRSGYRLTQVLESVAKQQIDPISESCAAALRDFERGVEISQVLANWRNSADSIYLSDFVGALETHQQQGRNLVFMLFPVSERILSEVESDGKLHGAIRDYAAESGAPLPDHVINC